MRNVLALLFSICSVASLAQNQDSTYITTRYGSENKDVQDLMTLMGIEKHYLEIKDSKLANKLFHLTYQEYKNGIPEPEVDLVGKRKDAFQFDSTGYITLVTYARRAETDRIETVLEYPNVRQTRSFQVQSQDAKNYSLRTDILKYRAGKATIPVKSKFPLLVYTLPYEEDGTLYYCSLAQSRVPVKEWYKQYRIKHFIVYQLQIE